MIMFRLLSLHTLQFRNCLTCVLDIMRSSPSFRSPVWRLGKEAVLILWNSALHEGGQCHRFESVAPSGALWILPITKVTWCSTRNVHKHGSKHTRTLTLTFHVHVLLLQPYDRNVRCAAIHDGVGFFGCGRSGFTSLPPGCDRSEDHESESRLSVARWDCSNSYMVCVLQDLIQRV